MPKDSYYMVRILEFVMMWILIIHQQDKVDAKIDDDNSVWLGCEALALISTLGLYVTLPFVWRIARRHELSRDVADWGEDGAKEGLHGGDMYSDSDLSSSGSDHGGMHDDQYQDGELPPE